MAVHQPDSSGLSRTELCMLIADRWSNYCNQLGVLIMGFMSRGDVLKLFNISVWTLRMWQKER